MSWQRTHKASMARKKRTQTIQPPRKISANDMLSASFYTGTGFQTIKTIYNMAGFTTQSRSSFYNKLPKAEANLVQKAEESMNDARKNFSGHIGIDCRWSSPVRGNHGTVSAVDLMSNKVIEESTLTKVGKNRPTGNFKGASNNMETTCTLNVLQQMKDHQIFGNLESITKDRDNKSKKVIENIGPEIKIRFDPGHFRKNFKTALSKFIKDHRVFIYYDDDGEEVTVNSPFYDLESRLIKWMNTCLKEKCDDKRVSMWLSTVDHYLGNHLNCLHDQNHDCYFWEIGFFHEPIRNALYTFVEEQAEFLANTSNHFCTQNIEFLNG